MSIKFNEISGVEYRGIVSDTCDGTAQTVGVEIYDNEIECNDNYNGILIYDSDYAVVKLNNLSCTVGVDVHWSDEFIIYGNTFNSPSTSIALEVERSSSDQDEAFVCNDVYASALAIRNMAYYYSMSNFTVGYAGKANKIRIPDGMGAQHLTLIAQPSPYDCNDFNDYWEVSYNWFTLDGTYGLPSNEVLVEVCPEKIDLDDTYYDENDETFKDSYHSSCVGIWD